MLARIAHTTDFSPQSAIAFRHALRLSLGARSRLDLLHVRETEGEPAWDSFPHVREALSQWRLTPVEAVPSDIEPLLGVRVAKIEIEHGDAASRISDFFLAHRPDLLVVATHGRHGLNRWLNGSVAEDVARRTHVPTLLIGPDSRGFVDARSGEVSLRRVLVPLTAPPSPVWALELLSSLLSSAGLTPEMYELVHVADGAHDLPDEVVGFGRIERLEGPVVETILRAAEERQSDLIAMPTAGRHGLLEALRGGTTSRVIAHARCPVLTLPLVAPGQ